MTYRSRSAILTIAISSLLFGCGELRSNTDNEFTELGSVVGGVTTTSSTSTTSTTASTTSSSTSTTLPSTTTTTSTSSSTTTSSSSTSSTTTTSTSTTTSTTLTGGNPVFDFYSDWNTYDPMTDASNDPDVLADADKDKSWPFMLNTADLLDVVTNDAEGLDFPTPNILKVTAEDNGTGFVRAGQPQFRSNHGYTPVPQIGDSIYWRYYIRVMVPDAYNVDPFTHGTQDADNFSLRNWQHVLVTKSNGTFELRIGVGNGNNAYPNGFFLTNLNKFQTYRIEQKVTVKSSTKFTISVKVFDASGDEVANDDDFVNIKGTLSLGTLPQPEHLFGGGPAHLTAFRTGLNSLKGASNLYPFTFAYISGVAICRVNWCGPYDPVSGR